MIRGEHLDEEPSKRDAVLRMFITNEEYDGEANISCPECGLGYSHVREVFTRLGTDPHEGGRAYPGTIAKGVTGSRRDALVIVFDGECGHAWELIIQQHKGVNLLDFRML